MRTTATCNVQLDGEKLVLGVGGELSLASAYPILSALRQAAPLATECAVDLADVESATPGGIEALTEVIDAARALFRVVTLDNAAFLHAYL